MNWAPVLRAGLALGLRPAEVWALSLLEWRALTGAAGDAALDRAGLDALRARFPDPSETSTAKVQS
ncbi:phage tail assembly chaperone [Maricaulis maris]|uniref:phage tail assembly chaperone n=1 Tax=Maricaulis maris TaxID=74318 RepID=UPI003B8CAC23